VSETPDRAKLCPGEGRTVNRDAPQLSLGPDCPRSHRPL